MNIWVKSIDSENYGEPEEIGFLPLRLYKYEYGSYVIDDQVVSY